MFNDRDLYILGGGGLLAVFCLLPNWAYWLKISLALLIMVLALVTALMRIGADRRTLEQQLYYYLRYRTSPKRYQYYGRKAGESGNEQRKTGKNKAEGPRGPIRLAWDDTNIYFLLTVWLAVIGVYFTNWLKDGGDRELAAYLSHLILR